MEAYQYKVRKKQEEIESATIDFDYGKAALSNTKIELIDFSTARNIILKYEWLKTMPLFNRYFFGIYFNIDNEYHLGGVVIYSEEYSANKSTTWDKYGYTNKIILLSRGTCLWWTPKNTASYFISKTADWLKKNTEYKIITASVDPSAGEIGIIYQSLNWHYVGLMTGNYGKNGRETKRFSVFIDGKLKHSRSIRKEFGTIKKDVILEKYPNAIFLSQYRKRRYFYFIGNKVENKKFLESIKHIKLEYPKKNNEIAGIIYLIENTVNNKKYVGQTTRGFNDRYNEYKNRAKCCNLYVLKAFDKYGFDKFKFNIIDTAQTTDELNYKEIKYIYEYDSTNRNLGYNIEFGGIRSFSHDETKEKLSRIRKNVKQSKEWIQKRVIQVSKPVIKIDRNIDTIIERYSSLADAGRNNIDGLSHEQILRKCLGHTKNNQNIYWCYEEDYINNTQKSFSSQKHRTLEEFSVDELKCIYSDYEKDNMPIREISRKYDINFSTLSGIFTKRAKPVDDNYNSVNHYVLTCKKTGRVFTDYINKSGCLTIHITETYPDFILESKFKRKQIELKTGKPWYYDFFEFKLITD